jgi:hypothetical protein
MGQHIRKRKKDREGKGMNKVEEKRTVKNGRRRTLRQKMQKRINI